MTTTFEIINKDRFINAFRKSPALMSAKIKRAIIDSAAEVERRSKLRTPIDTGRLVNSIRVNHYPTYAVIAPHTDYAGFVEFGTRYMKGRPYMGGGLEDALPRIKEYFEKVVGEVLEKTCQDSK